jgi:hypothetical protein
VVVDGGGVVVVVVDSGGAVVAVVVVVLSAGELEVDGVVVVGGVVVAPSVSGGAVGTVTAVVVDGGSVVSGPPGRASSPARADVHALTASKPTTISTARGGRAIGPNVPVDRRGQPSCREARVKAPGQRRAGARWWSVTWRPTLEPFRVGARA